VLGRMVDPFGDPLRTFEAPADALPANARSMSSSPICKESTLRANTFRP